MKISKYRPVDNARRSSRLTLAVPVVVWGIAGDASTFFEETQTLSVAVHGALVRLATHVRPNQKMVVYNKKTQEEMGCRVVHVRNNGTGHSEVGIFFEHPMPDFWKISFPPQVSEPATAAKR